MSLGPVEIVVFEFEGAMFTGEIAPALADAVDRGIARIIDVVFVAKDLDGTVRAVELEGAEPGVAQAMAPLVDDVTGMLSESDIRRVGDMLEPTASAAVAVIEHAWLRRLEEAVVRANGRLVLHGRLPAGTVERASRPGARRRGS